MTLPPYGDGRGGRIGLLGGSFNPAHEGHLHISLTALRRLRLDQVWWLVSPQNPLKPADGMARLPERMAGAHEAARDPRILVTDIETRIGTRYTADTLARLAEMFPRASFVWLMGADNLSQFHRWDRWSSILHTVAVAVLDRAPYSYGALASRAARRFGRYRLPSNRASGLVDGELPRWTFIAQRRHPASATAIRARRASAPA